MRLSPRIFWRNALYLRQTEGGVLHDIKGAGTENVNYLLCKSRTYALDSSRSQILFDVHNSVGELSLAVFSPELSSEAAVGGIVAFKDKAFALLDIAELADGSNKLSACIKVENSISVIFILEKDIFDSTLNVKDLMLQRFHLCT